MKLVNTIEFKKLGDDRGSLVSLEQNKLFADNKSLC